MVGGSVQGPCKPSKQEIQDQQDGTFVVVYVLAMSGKYKLEAVLGSTLINSYIIPCNQRAPPSSLHLREWDSSLAATPPQICRNPSPHLQRTTTPAVRRRSQEG
jgi:hypothetical protein